jgi:hypothetical protein
VKIVQAVWFLAGLRAKKGARCGIKRRRKRRTWRESKDRITV